MADVGDTQDTDTISEQSDTTEENLPVPCTNTNKSPDDLSFVASKNWAKEVHLSLCMLRDSQNSTYEMLLRKLSDIGLITRRVDTWDSLLSVDAVRDCLDSALFETELIEDLCTYLEQVDCEKVRLALQRERLIEENEWLAKEHALLQDRLSQLNKTVSEAEAHRDVENFIYRMRHGDSDETQTRSHLIESGLEEDGYITTLMSPKMRGIYNLCIKYISEGRLDVAVAMCTQLLRDRDRSSELSTLDYGAINLLLGVVLSQQGRYHASIANMEDALKTFEMRVGKEHPSLGCMLVQLAKSNMALKDYDKAQKYLQRAITLKKSILGEQHDEVIKLQVDLMEALLNLRENNQVVQLCQITSEILMFRYSRRDPLFIRAQTLAIRAYYNVNQIETAYRLLRSVLNECFPRAGKQTIITLIEHTSLGASVTQNDAYELYEKLENPYEIELLRLLQCVYMAQGKDEASQLVANVLDVFHL